MTQEFINRLFAAVMGKCIHSGTDPHHYSGMFVCAKCGKPYNKQLDIWFPSLDGEATKEVRDWFAKEMPEEWESYLQGIAISPNPQRNNDTFFTETYDRQSSISNLAQYIVDNYKSMFFEELQKTDGTATIRHNVKTLIVKPQFAEAVKVIEEGLKK